MHYGSKGSGCWVGGGGRVDLSSEGKNDGDLKMTVRKKIQIPN